MKPRLLYLCCDPGISPDGTKGASVHFRAMARAFAACGAALDPVLAREGDTSGFLPHRARVLPPQRGSGVAGELRQLAHGATVLGALEGLGPHDAVYERLSLFAGAGLAYARARDLPLAVEVNTPLWLEAERYRELHLRETAKALCLDVLRGADLVLTVSKALADRLAACGVPSRRQRVLGNGADLAAFDAAQPAERPVVLRDRPLLVFIGSLKPWHGLGFLARAFPKLRGRPGAGLWIVGDGPDRDTAAALAAVYPGDVVFEGPVPHDRIPGILKAADAVLAPYPLDAPDWFSPLKVVEALAARRPLIAGRVRCVVDTLGNADVPGLYEPDDEADFLRAVRDVMASGEKARPPEALRAGLDWRDKAAQVLEWLGLPAAAPEVAHDA